MTLNSGITYPQVEDQIKSVVADYFDKVRKSWDERSESGYECWIFRSQITAAILSVLGVANVQSLKLNNVDEDVQMVLSNIKQELPMLGEVSVV